MTQVERMGRTMAWVVGKESDAVPMIRQNVACAIVHADESAAWNILHASYPMKRVNHSVEFTSEDGAAPIRPLWGISFIPVSR